MATRGKEFFFNEEAHSFGEILQRAKIEVFENLVLLYIEKVGGDFRVGPSRKAALVEFAQDQAEQGGRDRDLGRARFRGRAGDILDNAILHAGRQQRRTQPDDLPRLALAHRQKAQTVLAEGAEVRANAIEIGQIILPHRQEDLDRRGLEIEFLRAHWIVAERGRRTVLDQIGELGDERFGPGRARGILAPQGEEFLELIERQERRDEIVPRAPEMIALAMKIFPERLVRERSRSFYLGRNRRGGDGTKHLRREWCRALQVIETNRNRKAIIFSKSREEAGLKKRRLAQTGDAVEQSEIIAPDQSDEVLDLVTATGEKLTIAFGKKDASPIHGCCASASSAPGSLIGRPPSGDARARCR